MLVKTKQHVEDGCFSWARAPNKGNLFPFGYGQVDILKCKLLDVHRVVISQENVFEYNGSLMLSLLIIYMNAFLPNPFHSILGYFMVATNDPVNNFERILKIRTDPFDWHDTGFEPQVEYKQIKARLQHD